jgi:hypothetical protein
MMLNQPLKTALVAEQSASNGCAAMSTQAGQNDEVAKLQAELDQMREMQSEMMRLLGTKQPNRILHDLRNLLQERIFLMAACKDADER